MVASNQMEIDMTDLTFAQDLGITSANLAFNCASDYADIETSIDSHRLNIQDTLIDEGMSNDENFRAATNAFDARVEELKAAQAAKLPAINDPVSYAFNGDYYPCGVITKISKNFKMITTSEGQKFYRQGDANQWKMHKTWSLVKGHIERQNPHF
jgi:outer membrane protein TolC